MKCISEPIVDEPGPPPVYKLPVEEKMCMSVDRSGRKIRKCWVGEPPIEQCPEKVLMVVGATGAGKTTIINGMVNYILDVQWKDNFRFKLIMEKKKTQQNNLNHCLHPEGLNNDKLITKQIKEFFSLKGEHRIDPLDGIGFVTQSSLAHLTHTQQYIFDPILAIFGSNVAQNIFLMVTIILLMGRNCLSLLQLRKPISHSVTSSSLTTRHYSLQPSLMMKRTSSMKCSGRWVLHPLSSERS